VIFEQDIAILILLNNKNESAKLKNELSHLKIKSTIFIAETFNHFVELINKNKFDVFFIEYQFKEVQSLKIIERLRSSTKYHRSTIALVSESTDELTIEQFSVLNISQITDKKFDLNSIGPKLIEALKINLADIIPKEFNVLVLDDNPDILDIMTGYLHQMNHTKITTCRSIEEAKNLMQTNEFDILFLDWNLPDGSCIDLIEFVRNNKNINKTANALIMVITGRNDVDDIMTLLRYNVLDHIIKPFDYGEFEEKVIYALGRYLPDNFSYRVENIRP
jgi:DNA-binding response OmpR family regulator